MRFIATSIVLTALTVAGATGPATAQLRGSQPDQATASYHIKPPDMAIPQGSKPGDIRRIIQPFGAWILICDENLKAHTRICNASQSIVDDAGHVVFSWSLAATRGGAPVFIVRAPIVGKADHSVLIGLGAGATVVALRKCDDVLCLGFLLATPEVRRAIAAGGAVRLQLPGPAGAPLTLRATLDGLALAIASIK